MKKIGILLIALGTIFMLKYYNMATTVTTEGKDFGFGITVPSMTVNNLGLMEERRNGMMMSGLAILTGVILFVAGTSQESRAATPTTVIRETSLTSREEPKAKTRKCPFCAEDVKTEAVVCRFCNRDLPPLADVDAITELGPEQLAELKKDPERLAAHYGIEKDGNLFKVHGKYFERLFDAVAHAEIKALKSKVSEIQEKTV